LSFVIIFWLAAINGAELVAQTSKNKNDKMTDNGKWKMENNKWKIGNRKSQIENSKYQIETLSPLPQYAL
jgi:hypothetical protein